MSLAAIVAEWRCDGCAAAFKTDIDPACGHVGTCVMDDAEDSLRGDAFATIENGQHYCRACTRKRDEEVRP